MLGREWLPFAVTCRRSASNSDVAQCPPLFPNRLRQRHQLRITACMALAALDTMTNALRGTIARNPQLLAAMGLNSGTMAVARSRSTFSKEDPSKHSFRPEAIARISVR